MKSVYARILLRSLAAAVIVWIGLAGYSSAHAAAGVVAYNASGCDYFIVESASGDYALLEWYGGHDPSSGDQIVGDFESYGFTSIVNATAGASTRVWVEDYWLSRANVVRLYTQKCGRPPVSRSGTQPTSAGSSSSGITSSASVVRSTISGEFEGWSGDTAFVLDNGQVWQQASYSYHYQYAYRPQVTIVAVSSGWIMQVEGVSETLPVRRLR